MSREAAAAKRARPCATTASYSVQFRKRPRGRSQHEQEPPTGRVPRVTRMLVLAHRIDGMIRAGEIKDWAEAARLVGVTRARMTQIANLLLLAPHIQESLLAVSPVVTGDDQVSERALRSVVSEATWEHQGRQWSRIS